MEPFVEIRELTAWRGETRVFDGLTLTLPRAQNTAVLGPNGAGKSTLLRLITRELLPVFREDTALRLFGRDRWDVWELRSRLGIVSHDLQGAYPGHFTGWDVVLSGFHSSLGVWDHQAYTEEDRAGATRLLERLGIGNLSEKRYARMSTGEQRRFLLARALVHEPEVLVLDEPTSGLDLKACFQYIEIVRGLMRSGTTLVLVTHHIHEIPPEIERVVLLEGGELVADGAKAEVLTNGYLSRTFGTPVSVIEAKGFYRAVPAGRVGDTELSGDAETDGR